MLWAEYNPKKTKTKMNNLKFKHLLCEVGKTRNLTVAVEAKYECS